MIYMRKQASKILRDNVSLDIYTDVNKTCEMYETVNIER